MCDLSALSGEAAAGQPPAAISFELQRPPVQADGLIRLPDAPMSARSFRDGGFLNERPIIERLLLASKEADRIELLNLCTEPLNRFQKVI
jgi:hypothetical protein